MRLDQEANDEVERLSDAGLHQRQAKALYLNHRPPPWLAEDAPRDRSNRLLDDSHSVRQPRYQQA